METAYIVGCTPEVDHFFREALVPCAAHATVHCAFPSRGRQVEQERLMAVCKVGNTPSPAAALHRRTVGMVSECTHLILLSDDPTTGAWGRESRLAFCTAVQLRRRVFMIAAIPPLSNRHARVSQTSLFGVVHGYLVEPVAPEFTYAA